MNELYLDYAATAPILPAVRDCMVKILDDLAAGKYGNASALHSAGQRSHHLIEDSRREIAAFINADPEEIIFTSGGTEANNTVMNIFREQPIAISNIEHPSIIEPAKKYASEVVMMPVDQAGRINPSQIPDNVKLVSVTFASNELGTLEPLEKIVKCCKNYNIYVHSDATQALGKVKIDVKSLGIDYLTLSAHKIGGPTGVGALYVRKGSSFHALLLGGHQESKRRAGTSNLLAIAGFGEAAKWCRENQIYQNWQKIATLRDMLRQRILKEIPFSSANTPEQEILPNILNMSFRAAEGESIQLYLDAEGIEVSTGSACAAGDIKPSHVLMAVTHDAEVAHSSIRFSLGLRTTKDDIDKVMSVLPSIIAKLQGMSTIKIEE